MSWHFAANCGSPLALSEPRTRWGLRSASFENAPDRALRDERDDAAFDRLLGQLALRPVRDGPAARAEIPAGQGNSGAGMFGTVDCRRTGGRRIGQTLGDMRPFGCQPAPPPIANRCAGNAEALGTRADADALIGEQYGACAQREVLGRSAGARALEGRAARARSSGSDQLPASVWLTCSKSLTAAC